MTRSDYIAERSIPEPMTGCWLWLLSTGSHGYGQCVDPESPARRENGSREVTTAHRVSYEAHRGPVPEGHQLDHTCRTRSCCNPDHLEAVTQQENIRRQWLHHPRRAA